MSVIAGKVTVIYNAFHSLFPLFLLSLRRYFHQARHTDYGLTVPAITPAYKVRPGNSQNS
jgi:hypothetical protein